MATRGIANEDKMEHDCCRASIAMNVSKHRQQQDYAQTDRRTDRQTDRQTHRNKRPVIAAWT